MPGLKLFTSNRLEILIEKLAEALYPPLDSPLEPEIIVVQSRGMERWVSMELALRLGVCANFLYPFPNHLIYKAFSELGEHPPEESPFDPKIMAWRIMGRLPSFLDRPAFQQVRDYLRGDDSQGKLLQLSERIAQTFDQYLVFRPEMILEWGKGKEEHWQAELWRELVRGHEQEHLPALREIFLQSTARPSAGLQTLPRRLSVFGISTLPRFHLQILEALSRFIEVRLFLMNPCREYWVDIRSDREMPRIQGRPGQGVVPWDQLHFEEGHGLLASMGRLGRDFFKLIYDLEVETYDLFFDPGQETLLDTLQSDILNLRNRGPGEEQPKILSEDDPSIQFHSCHSPMREVEVLQDRLLSFFEQDPALRPKDILVMAPDIKTYAPFIQAVFSIPPNDPKWIPFSIADRGVREESRLIDAFLAFFDLDGSRFGATKILALLEEQAIQRKFHLNSADLEQIHGWVQETRICWGIDGESRRKLGLPEFAEHTWRAGLDRMLLGYALTGRNEKMFMDILPYDRLEGAEAEVLGRLSGFLESLFSTTSEMERERTLEEWGDFLSVIFERFFKPDEANEAETQILQKTFHRLSREQALSGFDQRIGLPVIRSYLKNRLEKEGFGFGFLTGGLNFCAMLPMRSIPHKIICLIGMNGEAYPRQKKAPGFDLIAEDPRPGDRSQRHDDRYLFLETILSAREKLYISYVGQSLQDLSERPPSVLVSELMDALDQGFRLPEPGESILDRITFRHRLQAFSPEYFKDKGKLFSYSEENLAAARCLSDPPTQPAAYLSRGISEAPEEWKVLDPNQLCRFFENPARFLLNRRLGLYLGEKTESLREVEPFNLEALDRYQLRQFLVEKRLQGKDLKELYPLVKAWGLLPQGTPGECLYEETCAPVEAFAQKVRGYDLGEPLEPLSIEFDWAGFRISGRIGPIYARGLVHYRLAKVRARDCLRLWIHHLLLNLPGRESYPRRCLLIGENEDWAYQPIGAGQELLQSLLEIYGRGLTRPLPFFPESSWAYAESWLKEKDPAKALAKARDKWKANEFRRGEETDPYFKLCFGKAEPLDREFQELSLAILEPLLKFRGPAKAGRDEALPLTKKS